MLSSKLWHSNTSTLSAFVTFPFDCLKWENRQKIWQLSFLPRFGGTTINSTIVFFVEVDLTNSLNSFIGFEKLLLVVYWLSRYLMPKQTKLYQKNIVNWKSSSGLLKFIGRPKLPPKWTVTCVVGPTRMLAWPWGTLKGGTAPTKSGTIRAFKARKYLRFTVKLPDAARAGTGRGTWLRPQRGSLRTAVMTTVDMGDLDGNHVVGLGYHVLPFSFPGR